MKNITLFTFLAILSSAVFAQEKLTPATIVLEDGSKIVCHHFSQSECGTKSYFPKFIAIKGSYEGNPTEIKDYKDISKIDFLDFDEEPVYTGDNELGTIIVYKNGIAVTLENASISLSCYGGDIMHNQLQVQMLNPLTNKIFDKPVNTKDIQYIEF